MSGMHETPSTTNGLGIAKVSLLTPKLTVPMPRQRHLVRDRLLAQLDEGMRRPVTLLVAPAGYGKTTLLSSWRSSRGENLALSWVSLETSENDPVRFWNYIFAACDTVIPGLADKMEPLLLVIPSLPAELYLVPLINAIANTMTPIWLVLDDYHTISSPQIHDAMAFLLEHLPSSFHLIIATRMVPPFPLARLRAHDHITEIHADDLQLTPGEARTFLADTMQLSLTEDMVAEVVRQTEGWVAGLQLAALTLKRHSASSRPIPAAIQNHYGIFDYFFEEVILRESQLVQQFLLTTSLLDRLCGSLCDAITGEGTGRSQALLEQLERANLFLIPLDASKTWYRYHALFSAALRNYKPRLEVIDATEIYHKASLWCAEHDMVEDALSYALRGHDWIHAVTLIETLAPALLMRGETGTLLRWFDAVPDEVIQKYPSSALFRAWAFLAIGRVESLLVSLDAAEHALLLDGVGDGTAKLGEVATLRAAVAAIQGNAEETLKQASLALNLLSPDHLTERGMALLYLGTAHWLTNDGVAALADLHAAYEMNQRAGNLYTAMLSACSLAQMQALHGQLHAAARTYSAAMTLTDIPLPALGVAYIGLGNLEYEWNQLVQAEAHMREGIAICERSGDMGASLMGALGLAQVQLAQGIREEALKVLDEVRVASQKGALPPLLASPLQAALARLSLLVGNVVQARHWMRSSGLRIDDAPHPLTEREHITFARVLLALRSPGQALEMLEPWRLAAARDGRVGSVCELLALQALAYDQLGESLHATETLQQALRIGEAESYTRLFVDEGPKMEALIRRCSSMQSPAGSQLGAYCHALLQEFAPDRLPIGHGVEHARTLVEPLSSRELDVLALIAAGASNREVAATLIISLGTVKKHLNNIFAKLDVTSRTQAVAKARELGILH